MTGHLFPFLDYWWFYAAFTGFVVAFLVLDLGVFHRKAHPVGFREASAWTAVWAALALLFCLVLYKYAVWNFDATTGKQIGVEFLTGYVIEWSLSLDNMFVFVLVFRYFGTPARLQHRILFYGVLGALIFRGAFVVLGAAQLQYGWAVILFGVFLIFTGIRTMFSVECPIQPGQSLIVRGLPRLFPVATDSELPRFFLRRNGKFTLRRFSWCSRSSRPPIFFSPSIPSPRSLRLPASRWSSTPRTCSPFRAFAQCVFCLPAPLRGSTCCVMAWRSF
jgi:tellurite resistance protein TerC